MKRIALKGANYAAYLVGCGVLGRLWGMLLGFCFKGFLEDEGYAAEHPKKYLLGVIGVILLSVAGSACLIGIPLNWIREKLDLKIDEFADEKEWD